MHTFGMSTYISDKVNEISAVKKKHAAMHLESRQPCFGIGSLRVVGFLAAPNNMQINEVRILTC